MGLSLANIDRAFEWTLRDAVIKAGYWPDQRAFTLANDEDGFNTALAAMPITIDVFGVANFLDREKLKSNNIIVERHGLSPGSIGFSYPFEYVLQSDNTYDLLKTPDGSTDLAYRIRFVTFDVTMDRIINEIILSCFQTRKFIYGIKDDLTNTDEGFETFKNGDTVDLSGKDFIERICPFIVRDAIIGNGEIIKTDIQPLKTTALPIMNPNLPDADVQYPESENDISVGSFTVVDNFIQMVEALAGWNKLEVARMYAQESEVLALKNLRGGVDAENSGCDFTEFKGFYRSNANDFIDTKFSPSTSETFGLTNYTYMVFVTEAPINATLIEFFGLIDSVNNSSIFLKSGTPNGIQVKANSDDLIEASILKVKANTLYTIVRRNRFLLQIFEGDRIIIEMASTGNTADVTIITVDDDTITADDDMILQPTFIPIGNIFDLNIADENGNAIGTANVGGLAFSAAGPGLRGIEIRELNIAIRRYLTKIGLL